jgi:hypothetical protein
MAARDRSQSSLPRFVPAHQDCSHRVVPLWGNRDLAYRCRTSRTSGTRRETPTVPRRRRSTTSGSEPGMRIEMAAWPVSIRFAAANASDGYWRGEITQGELEDLRAQRWRAHTTVRRCRPRRKSTRRSGRPRRRRSTTLRRSMRTAPARFDAIRALTAAERDLASLMRRSARVNKARTCVRFTWTARRIPSTATRVVHHCTKRSDVMGVAKNAPARGQCLRLR